MATQIPVFIISLARAPERRASICAHLDGLGLSYQVMDAVDGKLMPEAERSALLAPGINYVAGVVGCYLSHVRVYEHIVREDIPMALILEDDARLNPRIVEHLKQGRAVTTDFDYCLLDCDDCSEDTPVYYDPDTRQPLFPGFPIYETNIGPALLHAYLMTRKGAQRRLEHAWPIYKPVDVYSALPYRPRILVCVDPKGAYVSEYSRQSFTSNRHDTEPLKLKFLRRFPLFYKLKDWLMLKPLKGRMRVAALKQKGVLSTDRRWYPMPSGRNIADF